MPDNADPLDHLHHYPHLAERAGAASKDKAKDAEEEDACPAFAYLRGIRERALAVEFRFRNGNRRGFAYSCFIEWWYNPSVGLLLKFTGDGVTLVLIRGSNLDLVLPGKGINLTDRGFQRHRIVWVREMDEDELRKAGASQPTIDRIDIRQFETQEELREWLKKTAPVFLQEPG